MKTTKRLKAQPITDRAEFLALVAEIAALEAESRAHAALRDIEIAAITAKHEGDIAPLAEKIKGKLALVEAYAEEHRAELLPKDAKSAKTEAATYGWRVGNRTVKFMSRVSEAQAISALKQLGLGAYVRTEEAVAKNLILCDCEDDVHLIAAFLENGQPVVKAGAVVTRTVPLANVGLKITQAETFFIEPASADANTVKAQTAA
jgi:phage host-nuclease inhibitor protein Gam